MSGFIKHIKCLLKKHRLGFILGLILSLVLILFGFVQDNVLKVLCYLLTLFVSFLFSELYYHKKKPEYFDWLVLKPKTEFYVIVCTQVIVISLMVYWFLIIDQQTVSRVTMVLTMVLRILFVFPIFFLIYFLIIKKYSLKELGILRFNHWYVGLPIILLIGGISYLFFSDGLQFKSVVEENGYLSLFTFGFLMAAIPEEITRNLLQSRMGKILNRKSLAWFSASFVWAIIHIPLFTFKANGDYYSAATSALGILPIGLLWGYLNERYKSIIPSVLIHGTNLWGLHNIL